MFKNIIGQTFIKNNIIQQIRYCQETDTVLPHMLFIGSAGYGKTLMATTVASEMGKLFVSGYGPSIEKEEQLVDLFIHNDAMIPRGTVILLDEIHAIKPALLEKIYTIIESFSLPIKSGTLKFPQFTLIAGTTDPQYLTKSMRDRFKNTYLFDKYTVEDTKNIVKLRLADNYVLDDKIYPDLFEFTGGVPRKIINMADNIKVFCFINNITNMSYDMFHEYLAYNGLTKYGLTNLEDYYIKLLGENNTLSLNSLASLLNVNVGVVTHIIEPNLLLRNLICMKASGRELTDTGRQLYDRSKTSN